MRWLAIPALLGCVGCVISRPHFAEAEWDFAPAPAPAMIVEITQEIRRCITRCQTEVFRITREGWASWAYLTKARPDSIFYADIDPSMYGELADSLVAEGFFDGNDDDDAWPPLSSWAVRTSASIICRRKVAVHSSLTGAPDWRYVSRTGARLDTLLRALPWRACGIDYCVPRNRGVSSLHPAGRRPTLSLTTTPSEDP